MRISKIGKWSTSSAIRVSDECKELGLVVGDMVKVEVIDGKIVISKVEIN